MLGVTECLTVLWLLALPSVYAGQVRYKVVLTGDAPAQELQTQVARRSAISIPVAAFHAHPFPHICITQPQRTP